MVGKSESIGGARNPSRLGGRRRKLSDRKQVEKKNRGAAEKEGPSTVGRKRSCRGVCR